jgi:hypothetical protein
MNIKRFLNIVFSAAFVMGVGMGIASCSDDDKSDDNSGSGEKTETELEQEVLGWTLITQLTDEGKAPEGWENKTFEPTIGSPVEGDPYTRVVATNTMESAAARFAELADNPPGFSEATSVYDFSIEGIGKLSYQRGSENGQFLAQVTVDLKQVPHLKKILYQTPEQSGNNSSFAGTAYYRFGDVVADNQGYYWICVRPAFGKEGKQDSHWLCLSRTLPDENLEAYKTSTGKQNYLPTGLGSSTKHMQNGAEMFFAMLHPDDWYNNLSGSTKPAMFGDFSTKNYQYHNIYFWQRVCKAWQDQDLFNRVLGVSKQQLDGGLTNGLHYLYSGYSWWWKTSWWCTLYEATYKNGTGKKSNMHDAATSKPKKDMHDIIVDAKSGDKVGTVNGKFFDNDNAVRWYVRCKTGAQLSTNGSYNEKTKISGCRDIYVYNNLYNIDLNNDPEVTEKEKAWTTRGFYVMGDVVKDNDGNRWICIQECPNNAVAYPDAKHAYFVSFDQKALGKNLSAQYSNLPSRDLSMQLFFCMDVLYHNRTANNSMTPSRRACENMKTYAEVDLSEIIAFRDTVHTYKNGSGGKIPVSFISTLYYDTDGTLCVLRMIGDYTASQPGNGGRDWSWRFYTSYTQNLSTEPKRMELRDLADITDVMNYSSDRWVTLPWEDPLTQELTPSPGYLRTTQDIDLYRFVYKAGRSWKGGTFPMNMYREPIVVFAVKRLVDTGVEVRTFEDGTPFRRVHLVSDDDPIQYDETHPTRYFMDVYTTYQHQMFLNDKSYVWRMDNAK